MERSPETTQSSQSTPPIQHQHTDRPNTQETSLSLISNPNSTIKQPDEEEENDQTGLPNGRLDLDHTTPPKEDDEDEEEDENNTIVNGERSEPKRPEIDEEFDDLDIKKDDKADEITSQDPSPRIESSDFDDLGPKNSTQSTSPSTQTDQSSTQSKLLHPHSHLPRPLAPPGLDHPTKLAPFPDQTPHTIVNYFRTRSSALARRLSSLKDPKPNTVTEFHITNLKVIVRLKDPQPQSPDLELVGRITFFSRSNCRDCSAVRSFFRERRLPYVEINVDVFPSREAELKQRTGSGSVPQIFFNEKLVGGLVALNSLRNSGEFERRLLEMAGEKCSDEAPAVPVYGFNDEQSREEDEVVEVARVARKRVRIRDCVSKMKLVRNCFTGSDLVEAVIHHMDCGRKKAVEIGKELLRKHFINHVFRENDFEDGSNLYRFLEHDPIISKCFNFRVATNNYEPELASLVGQRLTKLMFAILEAYASDDRRHLDYRQISLSEEFRRYVNVAHDLQRVDLFALSMDERLTFFLNLYNAMAIHAVIRVGCPEAITERRAFFSDFHYMVGGYPYSLSTIKNGILRSNSRQPYSFGKPFGAGDKRLELALPKVNPLIHFGLCNATRSSPPIQFFSSQGVEIELRQAAREFFQNGGVEVDLEKRTVYLTRIIKWYSVDFGQDRELLKWILNFLDATKAGLLIHLLSDGGPVNIVYQNYDWSLNI